MKIKNTLLVFCFSFMAYASFGQQMNVYHTFDSFEPLLHQQNDTTYVINFWATWCKPCVAELPYFLELEKKYQNQKFKLILVSLDFEKQLETKLKPFLVKNDIQSEVALLLDTKESQWIDKVDPSWSGAIPITLIYKNEKRAFYEETFHDVESLDSLLRPFLN